MGWLKGFFIGYGMGLAVFGLLAGSGLYYLSRIGVIGI